MRLFKCFAPALCLLAFSVPVKAQLPVGSIDGISKDPSGRLVQGAHVVATDDLQGSVRESQTNADGSFTFSNLAPGSYTVVLSSTGFADVRYSHVQVEPGRATTLEPKFELAAQRSTMTVSAAGVQDVDLTQSLLQGQITSTTIQNIPLNGRNFLELAFLIPGNRPAPNFDPTKTNTLEISSAGGFGRGGNITIDGGDNNDEVVGGTLSNLPQDSVAEFQIATARFTAEVGRSGNSIINIVTRSGGNQVHGSAFVFERNRHLQGLPATFNRSQPTPAFDREQFGGSMGGPFLRNKLFYFSSVEYRNQNAALLTGTRDFATSNILNTSAPAPLRDLLLSNRADYRLNDSNTFSLRYSFNRSTDPAIASASSATPQSTAAERQNALNRFNSAVLAWTAVISPRRTNEAAIHFDEFYNDLPPFAQNSSTTNPPLNLTKELIFPDLADGANFNLPQATHLHRIQLRDAFALTAGKHFIRFGGEFQNYWASGEINVFSTGSINLTSDFGFANLNGQPGPPNDLDIPIAISLKSSAPVTPVPIPKIGDKYLAFFVQDDWRARPNLTFNLGLRWEYDTNATGQSSQHQPCPTLTVITSTPCTWVANILPLHKGADPRDFGPRVGFVYDPLSHGRTVLRGGYGIYYDRITLEAGSTELVQNDRALTVTAYAGSFCSNPNVPGAPSLQTCFIPGSTFAPGSPTLANAFSIPLGASGVGLVALGQNAHHPLFQQFSLGGQQSFGENWLVSADGLHVFGQRQLIGSLLRATTSTSPDVRCPGSNVPCQITDPATGISDTITMEDSSAKSWYDGLLVSLAHRPGKIGWLGYEYNISYTLSKTLDYSDDDQLYNSNLDEQVNLVEGTAGLRKEKGYALSDERHRLTLYGEGTLPHGFSFAPIYTFGSGVPADTFLPSTANQATGATGSRLPLLSRNALAREIKNSDQLNAVINHWNALPPCPGAYPCNSGGPINNVPAGINFFSPLSSLDLRLRKMFVIRENVKFSLLGEGFNLFNQVNVRGFDKANFAGRDVSIGPQQQSAPVQANFYQAVSTAGGFFGSGGARAFQFAARLEF